MFLKIVFVITIGTICFFHFVVRFFIVSSFVVRRYDNLYLICTQYIPSSKFTIFIKKSVEKNQSISSNHGGFKMVFNLVRKKLFEQNYNFYVVISFNFNWYNQRWPLHEARYKNWLVWNWKKVISPSGQVYLNVYMFRNDMKIISG